MIKKYQTELKVLAASAVLGLVLLLPKLSLPSRQAAGSLQNTKSPARAVSKTSLSSHRQKSPGGQNSLAAEFAQLNFQGIVGGKGPNSELIAGDKILKKGDTLQGFKIVEIQPQQAILEKEGKTFSLSIEGLKEINSSQQPVS